MKAFIPLILAFLLLFPVYSSAGDPSAAQEPSMDHGFSSARETADHLEEQYGITIRIGPECSDVTTAGFRIGNRPSGRTPFLEMLSGYNYGHEINLIKDTLDKYPPGFFTVFAGPESPSGLRLLLADQILYEGESMAGCTTISDGYCNIFLSVGAFNQLNIHHEIWHAMEYRITAEYPTVFDDWYTLNPEDFLYSEDNYNLDQWDRAAPWDAFFVRGYSTIDEYEDRATVFEAYMSYDLEWWDEHPYIRYKLERMMEAAELVLATIYMPEGR